MQQAYDAASLQSEAMTKKHYGDVIMSVIASQITSLTIIYSIIYSGADQRKHQSSASLAFVRGIYRWPVNSPHKWPVTRKMLPFDDVIISLLAYLGFNMRIPDPGEMYSFRSKYSILTHWGRVKHICVGNLTTIVSDHGLSPWSAPRHHLNQCWNIANWTLRDQIKLNYYYYEIHTFSSMKMHSKRSSGKWWPRLGLNVLTHLNILCHTLLFNVHKNKTPRNRITGLYDPLLLPGLKLKQYGIMTWISKNIQIELWALRFRIQFYIILQCIIPSNIRQIPQILEW